MSVYEALSLMFQAGIWVITLLIYIDSKYGK
ncbi:MAG: putative holin-like toxin [Oscillospiraceae bacterium]|nr:putative holin-like toxin [Oscillospiraceae bacterium]